MPEMKSLTLNDKTYDSFVDPVARALASATTVINSASGESVTLSNASDSKLLGLRIYGKTTQDGTPTPDAPVELVSIGDSGNIAVYVTGKNDTQSMSVETPNGLPGIPVTSGGNYTDANGQQWICDEIDFGKGVYVKRINVVDFENAVGKRMAYPVGSNIYRHDFWLEDNPTFLPSANLGGMCNVLVYSNVPTTSNNVDNTICAYSNGGIFVRCDKYTTVSDFATWAKTVDLKVQYVLATPIETPLSEEEQAAYNTLHTYRNHTTVSNDTRAWTDLEYAMDAKKYIDSLVLSGGGSVARLSNVTLLASKWTGENSLYSQVVTIDGITEYSKVDLLPSVEQLAIFHNKDVAFVTENEDGVVTVFVIGDKPTQDYTMQVSITEVVV